MLGRLLAEMGFDEIEVTKYHGDKGIDLRGILIVTGGIPIRMAIQAKRWKSGVPHGQWLRRPIKKRCEKDR